MDSARRGSGLIYTLIIMVAMFAVISLAVDFGSVQLARSQLQSTTDAACLAGASGLPYSPAEARARACHRQPQRRCRRAAGAAGF